MLLCWCIDKTASEIKEFYLLPVGRELLQYDSIAVNTIVKNKTGEVASCDVPFSTDLAQFSADYLRLTHEVAESCENHDLTDSMVIGTSAIVDTEIDGAAGMNSGRGAAIASATSTGSGIRSAFASINLYSVGANIVSGLRNGMQSMFSSLMATARQMASQLKQTIQSGMQVHSPSRFTDWIGRMTGQGLINSLNAMTKPLPSTLMKRWATTTSSTAANRRKDAASTSTSTVTERSPLRA